MIVKTKECERVQVSPRPPYVLLAIVILAVVFAHFRLLQGYAWMWGLKDSYYSHGPLIVALFVLMLSLARRQLQVLPSEPSWLGVLMLVLAIPLTFVLTILDRPFLNGLAFMAYLLAAVLVVWGMRAARVLIVPMMFLSMMNPIPGQVIAIVTGKAQICSTMLATVMLRLYVSSVAQEGNVITSPNLPGPLIVAEACSGLKLILALLMVSVFLVCVLEGSRWKKILLVAMSFPISIVVNSLRVAFIGAVGAYSGSSETMHQYHDLSGYVTLGLCAVAVYAFARLIGIRQVREFEPSLGGSVTAGDCSPGGRIVLVVGIVLISLGAVATGYVQSMYKRPSVPMDNMKIPMTLGDWHGVSIDIDSKTRELLGLSDLTSRQYQSDSRPGVQVHLFAQRALDSGQFHDPHVCLPGSGLHIVADENLTLPMRDSYGGPIHAAILNLEGDYTSGQMIFWYDAGNTTLRRPGDVMRNDRDLRLKDLRRMLSNPLLLPHIADEARRREVTWYRVSVMHESGGRYPDEALGDALAFISDLGPTLGYEASTDGVSGGNGEAAQDP